MLGEWRSGKFLVGGFLLSSFSSMSFPLSFLIPEILVPTCDFKTSITALVRTLTPALPRFCSLSTLRHRHAVPAFKCRVAPEIRLSLHGCAADGCQVNGWCGGPGEWVDQVGCMWHAPLVVFCLVPDPLGHELIGRRRVGR